MVGGTGALEATKRVPLFALLELHCQWDPHLLGSVKKERKRANESKIDVAGLDDLIHARRTFNERSRRHLWKE